MPSTPVSIFKSNGAAEPFDEGKLVSSLKHAGATKQAIEEVVDEIERTMKEGMTTTDIYTQAFSLLHKHQRPAAVKYSIRRALFELGPDGFPFECFVARIFRLWGYETVTDQIVLGTCVQHEMDVVAWKGPELSMVEAKFHNEFWLKSDLKIVLYVKARFDDLGGVAYDYGGTTRTLSAKGHWLFTNTKFTDVAIRYGECNNLNMVGWNYPAKGNLHDIIGESGLHPITSLTTLTKDEKRNLIAADALTCIDIIGTPDVLVKAGIPPEKAEAILAEAQLVVQEGK